MASLAPPLRRIGRRVEYRCVIVACAAPARHAVPAVLPTGFVRDAEQLVAADARRRNGGSLVNLKGLCVTLKGDSHPHQSVMCNRALIANSGIRSEETVIFYLAAAGDHDV